MAGTLPRFLLRDSIQVAPWQSAGTFGTAGTWRAHVQETHKLLRNASGDVAAVADLRTFLRLGVTVPLGSRGSIRGRAATAVRVDIHDTRGLPTPDHLDVWWELVDFTATTTVTIRRRTEGSGLDEFGDPADTWTDVASGLEAAFVEDKQKTYESREMRRGVVETYSVRLRADAPVLEGDQLVDADGEAFVVITVVRQDTGVGPELGGNDARVTVRRVAATSRPS